MQSGATISMLRLKAERIWKSCWMTAGHLTPEVAKMASTWKKSRPMLTTAMFTPFWFRK